MHYDIYESYQEFYADELEKFLKEKHPEYEICFTDLYCKT